MNNHPINDDFFAADKLGFDPRPGVMLRRRPIIVPNISGVSTAWQIVYASRTGFGAPIPASATVIVPDPASIQPGGRILLYCPEFHGLGGGCAPSRQLVFGSEPEAPRIEAAVARGWIVAIADGLGLGMNGVGPHLWPAGSAAAHAGLDAARATVELLNLEAGAGCVVWGYGDGGRAALWTAELQPRYAPDIDLRGVVAGAVFSDLRQLAQDLDGTPCAGLVLAAIAGSIRAYSHLPLRHILTEEGHLVVGLAGELDLVSLLERGRGPVGQWCERPDPWNDPLWGYVMTNERTSGEIPRVPVHLYHGTDDPVIPTAMGRAVAEHYRNRGIAVSWQDYPADHSATAAAATGDALDRAADFLARHPAPQPPPLHPDSGSAA
ncbi:lipase family protein [Nocardia carnea]|uniref:lipase family protein n=1 Tax=Nocardia carnea TaxID=37328 RepID=UPI0024547FE3|nr:lipase family protein [Nocardia carnea]